MRAWIVIAAAVLLCAAEARADEQHQHKLSAEEIGSIHFATSCAKNVEGGFNRAVALLHSFQYEQARAAFQEVAKSDPQCAMAQWGIAMTHYHGLWGNSDMAAGRAALTNAKGIAGSNSKTTKRERGYIGALEEVYRDGQDPATHARGFEAKMGELQIAYPKDSEAAIFHALSLDIVYVAEGGTDKTYANQRKCGEILEPIFKQQPHHPGIAHYIIHCYDNPVLAEQGLGAARLYAKIAPASAHANHMPSHLFTRVGSWDEAISSNIRSLQLAEEAEKTSTNGEARDQRLHAMDYLEYAYLQSGRVQQGRNVWKEMQALKPVPGLTLTGNYSIAAVPARLAVELQNWSEASNLQVPEGNLWTQAISWTAIGEGAARSGNLEKAREAEQKLAALRDAIAQQKNMYWSNQVEVQRREVAGWIAQASEKREDAVAALRSAAELEESMDKHAVTPGPVTPAREMLAEMLALQSQPKEALVEYQTVLKMAPNRFNALYGAGNAAEASGDTRVASEYFQKLTQIAVGEERPELATARKKIAVTAEKIGR
jgi:tetratricopeptide (TPR) repeat protein